MELEVLRLHICVPFGLVGLLFSVLGLWDFKWCFNFLRALGLSVFLSLESRGEGCVFISQLAT
jgi:hypothetical protein